MDDDNAKLKDYAERLLEQIYESLRAPGKRKVIDSVGGSASAKRLRKKWVGYCLRQYAKEVKGEVGWTALDNAITQREKKAGRAGKGYNGLQKMPQERSVGRERSIIYFTSLAEVQDNISLRECLLRFLRSCKKQECDLDIFGGRAGLEKHIDVLEGKPDIECGEDGGIGMDTGVQCFADPAVNDSAVVSSTHQPYLTDPPELESVFYYGNRKLKVIGRRKEKRRLYDFLRCDMPFAWFQLAGVAGQGKSRLAYELIRIARRMGWSAGLLEPKHFKRFPGSWADWQPDRRHLIVLDYVIGREDGIRDLMEALSCRTEDNKLRERVRVLLVERQCWNQGGFSKQEAGHGNSKDGLSIGLSQGRADWFLKLCDRPDGNDRDFIERRFDSGVLELGKLDQGKLVELVKQVARLTGGREIDASDDAIEEQLEHIDPAGRPLYAYFLGQAIVDGGLLKKWTKYTLLTDVLYRNINIRWRRMPGEEVPELGDDDASLRIALIATMTGGLDCRETTKRGLLPRPDKSTRRRAIVFADGPIGGGAQGVGQYVPNLQPDLLGEWFVLHACEEGQAYEDLLDTAWRCAPVRVAEFMFRLAQDFPEHTVTRKILDFAPPDTESEKSLVEAAALIVTHLYRAECSLPVGIVRAIKKGAEGGDGRAMVALGFCYSLALGMEKDLDQALHWYRKGADVGDGGAMFNIGACYTQGRGVEQDMDQAVHWYRKGADVGDGHAMSNLGVCYEKGLGVEQDLDQAVHWYRKGADVGNGGAMSNLGFCYAQGRGVEQDLDQAVHWYRKGADVGDGRAMSNLGVCYAQGLGVEQNLEQGVHWHRKGADVGDGQAMFSLGVCYHRGWGVEQDLGQAIHWYRKGADVGEGRAMSNLGLCYAQGWGMEQDLGQAIHWYRKGADVGEGGAMSNLGNCYEQGLGVEQDLDQAVHWYQEASKAGVDSVAERWRRLLRIKAFLSGEIPDKVKIEPWAIEQAEALVSREWSDLPPLRGDWRDVAGKVAARTLTLLRLAMTAEVSAPDLENPSCSNLRQLPLLCYPEFSLVDAEFHWSDQQLPLLCSALVGPQRAILLKGTADILQTINPHILSLNSKGAAENYLRFYCAFVRGEKGPFHIVSTIDDIPIEGTPGKTFPADLCSQLSRVRYLDGTFEDDGYQRYEATLMYADGIFRATMKLDRSGKIDMEGDELIAASLPILQREYIGAFRTPPQPKKPK